VAAVEVYQPALLDSSISRLVEAYNRQLPPEKQNFRLELEQQEVNGRVWKTIRFALLGQSMHWTYDRGYLVASSDRGLATQAIATRSGGFPLVRSERFRGQLPVSTGVHISGFVWLNTQGAFAQFAGVFGGASLRTLLESREPVLVVFKGETERIQAASRTRLMSLVLGLIAAGAPAHASSPTHAASN
jgi:hypothetical protein